MTARTPVPSGQMPHATEQAAPYQGTFPGRTDQLSQVRREIAGYLEDCPVADEMVLIADELAGPDGSGIRVTGTGGRTAWARLTW